MFSVVKCVSVVPNTQFIRSYGVIGSSQYHLLSVKSSEEPGHVLRAELAGFCGRVLGGFFASNVQLVFSASEYALQTQGRLGLSLGVTSSA